MERFYETIYILRPTLNDQEIAEAIENYKDLLVRQGAVMHAQEDLGKKKLAYLIKHFQNGHYVLYRYKAVPAAVNELERSFKISEDVLRFLTVKLDGRNVEPPVEVPTVEAETAEESAVEETAAEETAAAETAAVETAGEREE